MTNLNLFLKSRILNLRSRGVEIKGSVVNIKDFTTSGLKIKGSRERIR